MRCRRNKIVSDSANQRDFRVVWFGSYGTDENGKALFFNKDNKHDNFSSKQQAVVDSLSQRLSVLKGELWYSINEGLPLLDKTKSKLSLDSALGSIILKHPDVTNIIEFNSKIFDRKYHADVKILSVYGEISINL